MKRLLFYATLIVLANCALTLWHLIVLSNLQPGLTSSRVALFAILVNLVPFTSLVLMWMRRPQIGAWLLILILGVGFAIGTYTHLVRPGPDNVFQMAPGEWAWPFRLTATLLLVIEALGCWVGISVARSNDHASETS